MLLDTGMAWDSTPGVVTGPAPRWGDGADDLVELRSIGSAMVFDLPKQARHDYSFEQCTVPKAAKSIQARSERFSRHKTGNTEPQAQ
jgi:hypothetical protein